MSDEQREKILLGPRARAAIEAGKQRPVTKEKARAVVTESAKMERDVLRKKVEEELTPKQKEILEQLRKAKGSEERVKVFATIADDFGLDALVSLIPELGDAGSSIVSGIYLLMEAKRAGLGKGAYLKIIGLQAADFAAGAIPVLGDAADYFFKANKWSGKSFEAQTRELVEKAREAGVPPEKIAMIQEGAAKWPKLAGKAVGMASKVKKLSDKRSEKIAGASTVADNDDESLAA